jgi:hypothetical protein
MCGSLSPRPLAISLHALTFRLGDKILYVKLWFLTAMILRFLSSAFWLYTKLRGVACQEDSHPQICICFLVVLYIFPNFVLECFCLLIYCLLFFVTVSFLFCFVFCFYV